MPFQVVVLWSDALFFGLVTAVVMLGMWARRQAPLRHSWARVASDKVAMVSATVLAAFLFVGVLDSLHYRARLDAAPGQAVAQKINYAVEVNSLLDVLLAPLRLHPEKTYSAPLATHLFSKEPLPGSIERGFPRLTWGGAHLGYALEHRTIDIVQRSALGAAGGLLLWLGLMSVMRLRFKRQGQAIESAQKPGAGEATMSQGGRAINALLAVADGDAARKSSRRVASHATLLTLLVLFLIMGVTMALGSGYHVLGTDKVGQDVLYLSLKSIRTGLLIGTLTTLVMLPVAVLLGILAGYLGGWVDDVIQYAYTTLNSIPGVLLIAAAVLMMQVVIDTHPDWFVTSAERADARLLALCLILGMTSWTGLARLLRGETLKLRELEFVQAARAFGVSHFAIMQRHILPNLMHIVLIALVMDFSGLVLAEAVLSYVGVGVDPATISFGTMINAARMELARDPMVWWSLAAAFTFMFILVLAANLLTDAVRDAFDPRTAA
ncbi:MAG: ABC transporter permease [Rugosibacter sp.]|nr:MAG: ABC transporter permease [Rugosibacter sp.]TBR08666.1 MAG: ABC transporter permease [Rugosibacter sp.]